MLARQDPGLERHPRRERLDGEEALGRDHDPPAVLVGGILLDDVAEHAALLELVVAPRALELLHERLGNDGRGDELGVGVLERRPRAGAVVLEDEDVADAPVTVEIHDALAVRLEHLDDVGDRQIAQVLVVLGPLDHHLVGPHAVHLVVEALAPALEDALDLERGELVRHHADLPAGAVGGAARGAGGVDLGRGLVLVARTEGAIAGAPLEPDGGEVRGPAAALGRDDHPAADHRVLAELGHAPPYDHELGSADRPAEAGFGPSEAGMPRPRRTRSWGWRPGRPSADAPRAPDRRTSRLV